MPKRKAPTRRKRTRGDHKAAPRTAGASSISPVPPADPSARPVLHSTLKKGETPAEGMAAMAVGGVELCAFMTWQLGQGVLGPGLDITECTVALHKSIEQVTGDDTSGSRGDLSAVEAQLVAQAAVLNALFIEMLRVARQNQHYPEAVDRYMKFGLRAQSQCRATLETLAAIKNPPTVFARQANIVNGPQQVNNNANVVPGEGSRARVEVQQRPTKLLEAHGERVDGEATTAASTGDSAMAAVGTVNGTAHDGRQGQELAQSVSRRPKAPVARVDTATRRPARQAARGARAGHR